MRMQIEQYFERKDPDNDDSEIIYRGLQFETPLKPECVKKVAQKHIPEHADKIVFLGIFSRKTRFRVNIDEIASAGLPRFLYHVMNWEGNTYHSN
jgi:hypothetical protein